MSALPFPDVSVQLTQRRWRCVLDPNLALSPAGPEFARRLSMHAEVWLGTEFFNILDSAFVYEKEPELLAWPAPGPTHIQTIPHILRDWTRLRDDAVYGGSPFYWIGDVLRESRLPPSMNDDVVRRWEQAARSLDERLPRAIEESGPLIATMRDTVALSTTLPAAILTLRDKNTVRKTPLLCQQLERWGIACEQLQNNDKLASAERDGVRRLLVQATLAGFLWAGLDLVMLHVHAPCAGRTLVDADALSIGDYEAPHFAEPILEPIAPWHDARAFWYCVRPDCRDGG